MKSQLASFLLIASLLFQVEILFSHMDPISASHEKPLMVFVLGVERTGHHMWEPVFVKLAEFQGLRVHSRDKLIRSIIYSWTKEAVEQQKEIRMRKKVERLKEVLRQSNSTDFYYEDLSYPTGYQQRYTDIMVRSKFLTAFFFFDTPISPACYVLPASVDKVCNY